MFQVGAINPNVGNDRRKQLIDQLVQQLQHTYAQQQQQGETGAMGFSDLLHKRNQTLLPSAPTRAAGANNPMGNTAMTTGGAVPGAVIASMLGPGGISRFNEGISSAHPGAPVAPTGVFGRVGNAAHMGNAIPASAAPPTMMQPGNPGSGGEGPPGVSVPGISTPAQVASGMGLATHTSPPSTPGAAPVQLVGPDAKMAGGATLGATPSGLVPIGNGAFFDPVSGQVYGGSIVGPGARTNTGAYGHMVQ